MFDFYIVKFFEPFFMASGYDIIVVKTFPMHILF